MSLIAKTLAAGVEISRAIDGDHLFVESAPGRLSIVVEDQGGSHRTYVLGPGGSVEAGRYKRVRITSPVDGKVEVQATMGRYDSNLVKLDPNNNTVSMAETVNVSIDEIGITATKNTVKLDPNNAQVSMKAGEVIGISASSNTVKFDPDNAQVTVKSGEKIGLDSAANTVKLDASTNTVKIDSENNTVDINDQTIKTKPSTGITMSKVPVSTETAIGVHTVGGQRLTIIPLDGDVWVGRDGVTKDDGYPVFSGDSFECHTIQALRAVSDSGNVVDVRVIRETFN